jgi:hypothetical protein
MSDRDDIAKVLMSPWAGWRQHEHIEDRRNDAPVSRFDYVQPQKVVVPVPPPTTMSRALGSDELDAMDRHQYLDRIFGK